MFEIEHVSKRPGMIKEKLCLKVYNKIRRSQFISINIGIKIIHYIIENR